MKKEEKFRTIYDDTYDHLLKYLVYHCSNYDDANDIAQETYADLYRQFETREIEDVRAYVMGIARNKLKRYYNDRRVDRENMMDKPVDDPAVAAMLSDGFDLAGSVQRKVAREEVWRYLHGKDALTAEIFEQYYRGGWTIRQIAVRLKVGESTVKNRLYRTLKELHKIYNKEGNMKMRKKNVRLAAGTAIILIAVGGVTAGLIYSSHNDYNADDGYTIVTENRIFVNKMDAVEGAPRVDADIKTESDEETIPNWMSKLKLPNELNLQNRSKVYTKELCEDWRECLNKPYDVLHERVVTYKSMNGDERVARIAYSAEFMPLRDYLIDEDSEISDIRGIAVTIGAYEDSLVATFQSGGTNYDIESNKLSVEEMVGLVESIIVQ